MKVINQSELGILVAEINRLRGSIVQKIFSSEQAVALGLWTSDGLKWLFISLEKALPIVLPLAELPVWVAKKTTPVGLFLNAHIKGKIFEGASVQQEFGRIVNLKFTVGLIEIRLFSQGVNLVVYADNKKISFEKVKELTPAIMTMAATISESPRNVEQMVEEWFQLKNPEKNPGPKIKKDNQSSLQKNQKAISKIEKDISEKQKRPWREIGDWLKAHQTLSVPAEFKEYIDLQKTWSENMASCFGEAKKNEEKIKKAMLRIEKLKTATDDKKPNSSKPKENVFSGAEVKGRTLHLSVATAFIGKSARDNLKILRGANAWDLWLHLKDFPSAHVIIARPKGLNIAEDEIRKVGEWLIKESVKKNYRGIAYEIIICECRHVKPIKGDKAGRVHFQNERVFRLKVDT